jgi:hypothetical protein
MLSSVATNVTDSYRPQAASNLLAVAIVGVTTPRS